MNANVRQGLNGMVRQYGLETTLLALLKQWRWIRLDELVSASGLGVLDINKPMQRLVKAGIANPTPSGWEINVMNGEPKVYKHQQTIA